MSVEEKNVIAQPATPRDSKSNTKFHIPSLKPKARVDEMKVDPDVIARMKAAQVDLFRLFQTVFNNEKGRELLDHLDKYSHKNFPNYDNVNATYSKIGEQTMVDYIKNMLYRAKEAK